MKSAATRLPASLLLLAAVLVARLPAAEGPREKNLLANGSFEQAAGDEPTAWKTHTWQGSGLFEHAAAGRTGPAAAPAPPSTAASRSGTRSAVTCCHSTRARPGTSMSTSGSPTQ